MGWGFTFWLAFTKRHGTMIRAKVFWRHDLRDFGLSQRRIILNEIDYETISTCQTSKYHPRCNQRVNEPRSLLIELYASTRVLLPLLHAYAICSPVTKRLVNHREAFSWFPASLQCAANGLPQQIIRADALQPYCVMGPEDGHGADYAHAVSARKLRRLDSVGARVRLYASRQLLQAAGNGHLLVCVRISMACLYGKLDLWLSVYRSC
jgi:hypothetical protein